MRKQGRLCERRMMPSCQPGALFLSSPCRKWVEIQLPLSGLEVRRSPASLHHSRAPHSTFSPSPKYWGWDPALQRMSRHWITKLHPQLQIQSSLPFALWSQHSNYEAQHPAKSTAICTLTVKNWYSLLYKPTVLRKHGGVTPSTWLLEQSTSPCFSATNQEKVLTSLGPSTAFRLLNCTGPWTLWKG